MALLRRIAGRARRGWRTARDRVRERLRTTAVAATPLEWRRTPTLAPGDEVCLFLIYAAHGRIPAHALAQARAWAAAGFRLVLVVTLDDMATFAPPADLDFAAGLLLRRNEGYDFGAWAAAIRGLPALSHARLLAIANDSVFGPLASFPAFLARVRTSDADFIGAVESRERRHHYQSFLLFFAARALRSEAFWRFWNGIRNGSRDFVIDRYETRLRDAMTRGGLTAEALFPAAPDDSRNLPLTAWRELIAAGFPFVKVRLLRDNPKGANLTGWRATLRDAGYDLALIDAHLAKAADD